MVDLLLPRTDAGAMLQTAILVPVLLGILVAVRRHAELRTLVLGVLLLTLGLLGLRAIH